MRIAWITYDFEEYSVRHVNEMAKDHEVLLVMPNGEPDSPVYEIDPRVSKLCFDNPRLRQPLKHISTIRGLLKQIHAFQPDVVHYQQGHLWFNFALSSLKQYPLVVTIHDPRHHAGDSVSKKTPQWVMDKGFRTADHVIVHGEALKSQVIDLFGFDARHVHVIPHVSMGDTGDGKDTPSDNCNEDPNQVLFFGRIWDYKGLDYLIQAEPLISQRVPEVKIVIGGEGEDFDRYRKLIRNPERFEIHNRWISDEERAEMFRRSAIVVLPYREATQSGVVPVAYNFQKPVVATRVGALAECVEDKITGLLVEPGNIDDLADAIVTLLQQHGLRHEMGQSGKDWLQRKSSPTVVAQLTTNVYSTAMGLPAAAGKFDLDESKPVGAS